LVVASSLILNLLCVAAFLDVTIFMRYWHNRPIEVLIVLIIRQ